ncbi:SSBP2 protein, partial [Aramus guarauna]|nr:SSBP2 protein [Aramus guarauna]
QALGGVPGSQPLLPSGMDPTRQQGHPNMGGPMQRITPPRGMVPLGPQVHSISWGRGGSFCFSSFIFCYRGPGGGRPWPNPTSANSIPYSSASPGNYVVGGPIHWLHNQKPFSVPFCSTINLINCGIVLPPLPDTPEFPMGPGSDGPMSGLGGMDSHHMNGSLG